MEGREGGRAGGREGGGEVSSSSSVVSQSRHNKELHFVFLEAFLLFYLYT